MSWQNPTFKADLKTDAKGNVGTLSVTWDDSTNVRTFSIRYNKKGRQLRDVLKKMIAMKDDWLNRKSKSSLTTAEETQILNILAKKEGT